MRVSLLSLFLIFSIGIVFGQSSDSTNSVQENPSIKLNYLNPNEYILKDVEVVGGQGVDKETILLISDLAIGDPIVVPGDKITRAIQKLWKQGLFEDIQVKVGGIVRDSIKLEVHLKSRPRLSKFTFRGIKKNDVDDLKDQIGLMRGKVVTDNLKINIENIVRSSYIEKGFLNTTVEVEEKNDSTYKNGVILFIRVDKKDKIKINSIHIAGAEVFKEEKLKRKMKETKEKKWYRIFKASRYTKNDFNSDKQAIIDFYNNNGYKDVVIEKDTIYDVETGLINIELKVIEGSQYYFGNIEFSGNTQYVDSTLQKVFAITDGEVFDQSLLDQQLYASPSGRDISSLYMDNGYLFFQVTPIEKQVKDNKIDLEIKIFEGQQATINKVIIEGNVKTNDHVIRREIRTVPGQKFSRSDIIRTQRELANLGYFNPETMDVRPIPHPENGTVDIVYKLEEKSTDQIEMSAGWGAGRIVGTLGLGLNNFSARNIFKKGGWSPVPHGDGQKFSIRASSTGPWFQSYNATFTEPWLGGTKPNSLTLGIFNTIQKNYDATRFSLEDSPNNFRLGIFGGSVNLGVRLKWPDDNFILLSGLEYKRIRANNHPQFIDLGETTHVLTLQETFSRNTVAGGTIYPTDGSRFSFTFKSTAPYSLLSPSKDIEHWRSSAWKEYYKLKFDAEVYTPTIGKLVMKTRMAMGYMGVYSKRNEVSAVDRFQMPFSPMQNQGGFGNQFVVGVDQIALRGYPMGSIVDMNVNGTKFVKFSMEQRFPISLNPSSTMFLLAFVEAGNVFLPEQKFNPFELKRSAGVGARISLPMFGLIGVDLGYGFDRNPNSSGYDPDKPRFSTSNNLNFLFFMGFEPF